jgi:hypothetical protein
VNRIDLIAKRQEDDLHNGHPDYHVYAGRQMVGRIYKTHLTATKDNWFWGINAITWDMSLGEVMHGSATGLDDAKMKLRATFEKWLVWALAIPATDLKHPHIAEELSKMGPKSGNAKQRAPADDGRGALREAAYEWALIAAARNVNPKD